MRKALFSFLGCTESKDFLVRVLYFYLLLEYVGFFLFVCFCNFNFKALNPVAGPSDRVRQLCGERHVEAYLRLCSELMQNAAPQRSSGKEMISNFQTRHFVFSVSYQDTLKHEPKQRKWFQPVLWGDTLHLIRKWRFMPLQKHIMASKYLFCTLSKKQVKYGYLIMPGMSKNLFLLGLFVYKMFIYLFSPNKSLLKIRMNTFCVGKLHVEDLSVGCFSGNVFVNSLKSFKSYERILLHF